MLITRSSSEMHLTLSWLGAASARHHLFPDIFLSADVRKWSFPLLYKNEAKRRNIYLGIF
jgi:hypothetical protein